MNIKDNHIIWNMQSENSSESMPIGGGNIGGNVWVQENQLFLYLQQSGWFDENNSLLKAGRIRISIDPCPSFQQNFSQELLLEEGYISIAAADFRVNIWVDVHKPIVHIEYDSKIPRKIRVDYETWRAQDREVDNCSYELFQCKEMYFYPHKQPIFHKDVIVPREKNIFFYHKNDNDDLSFYKEFKDQGLQGCKDAFNPQKDLVFGGMIQGTRMTFLEEREGIYQDTAYHAYCYETLEKETKGSILVALSIVKNNKEETLQDELELLLKQGETNSIAQWEDTKKWWGEYFSKSFIFGSKKQKPYFEITRNYQLFRYMLGCNYYGEWPTKFNGGLFTFDPSLGGESPWSDDKLEYTPDYRLWGGGSHTIQNQRLLYWPMLKAGDTEPMVQHFDFFQRTLPVAKYRCLTNFNIIGAMYPEQVGTYGLCCGCDNEWGNKSGLPVSQIKYDFSNSLETVLMILEYYRYTGLDISEYISFMEHVVLFYHHFYDEDDENGKMIIYPANALETYHVVKNPIDAIAGLQTVVAAMLQLPENLFSKTQKEQLYQIEKRIPTLKTREKDNHTILAYADTKSLVHNCEIPELYTVFPYRQFGIGKENIELAKDTARYAWQTEEQLTHISWHPTGIQYARLGMVEECEAFLFKKMKSGNFRFPAFWGPGHDWTPDHNWGGSGMIQLQEMLLQSDGNELRILPCWNKEIDITFKLHVAKNTIVECCYKNGNITNLVVVPKEREKDIILPEWM